MVLSWSLAPDCPSVEASGWSKTPSAIDGADECDRPLDENFFETRAKYGDDMARAKYGKLRVRLALMNGHAKPANHSDGPKIAHTKTAPNWHKKAPWLQESPEMMAPRWPKTAQDEPRWLQEAQDSSKMARGSPKIIQYGPKLAHDGTKMASRGLQVSKWLQDGSR